MGKKGKEANVQLSTSAAMKRVVGVNEAGMRVGQDHQNAKLSDEEVEQLLVLRAEGWGWRRLAAKFEVSKRTVRDIVAGRRRNQLPTRWKVLERPGARTAD